MFLSFSFLCEISKLLFLCRLPGVPDPLLCSSSPSPPPSTASSSASSSSSSSSNHSEVTLTTRPSPTLDPGRGMDELDGGILLQEPYHTEAYR